MLPTMLAVACAIALAWWSWRDRLPQWVAWGGALCRAVALTALFLLLLDPSTWAPLASARPLALLDRSVSMFSQDGLADSAARLATSLGDTVAFGALAPGIAGDDSRLTAPLRAAIATGRPVVVVSDGEIPDAAALPRDLLAQVTVRLVARVTTPDIALTDVRAPSRVTAGDTLAVDIDATRTLDAPDTAEITLRDSVRALARTTLHFVANHASGRLRAVLPRGTHGTTWLQIAREGAADGQSGDDVRWIGVRVMSVPGVVVLAATPDFDARALYRTLHDVLDFPVRGFVQLRPGQWWRMDNLQPVTASAVRAAALHADLVAVRGSVASWRGAGRARLLWPSATVGGDWYISGDAASPVSSAFVGVTDDSLPPAAAITGLPSKAAFAWVGATAQLSRHGPALPMLTGQVDSSGRIVTLAADGLFRWSLRGGMAQQTWRTMIADAAAWLLAAPSSDSSEVELVSPVTRRGEPVHFRWTGSQSASPVAIHLTDQADPAHLIVDTLRFDAAGDASLALPVGRFRYAVDGRDQGTLVVEPYSPELLPSPVTLSHRIATIHPGARRRPVRDMLSLFALAIAAFALEWLLRRRARLQ